MDFDYASVERTIYAMRDDPHLNINDVFTLYERVFSYSYQTTADGFDDRGAHELATKLHLLIILRSNDTPLDIDIRIQEIYTNVINQSLCRYNKN
jgi:hypothetical protein